MQPPTNFINDFINLSLFSDKFFICSSSQKLINTFRKYNGIYIKEKGIWKISLCYYHNLVSDLKGNVEIKSKIPDNVLKFIKDHSETNTDYNNIDISHIESQLTNRLFEYQKQGIRFGISLHGKLIIADEMGLGKSIQALCVALYYKSDWPMLIIAPSSLLATWQELICNWTTSIEPFNIEVCFNKTKIIPEILMQKLIVIISFDLASRYAKEISNVCFNTIIVDECHFLKNRQTKRVINLLPILKASARCILLSGTPLLSRPIELFTQINAINFKLFPNFINFGLRYCDGKRTRFGWDMSGSSNLDELQVILNYLMIRRYKKDVMEQLPPKIREQIFLSIPEQTINIIKSKMNVISNLTNLEGLENNASYMQLWSESSKLKIPYMIEYLEDVIKYSNSKILLFAHHQFVLDAVQNYFITEKLQFIRIDGHTPSQERQLLCEKFQQQNDVLLALLSITAASVGITLTAATNVIFLELFFNPGLLLQAEDRAHRIGQTESVFIRYLIAKGTMDDKIWPLILKKLNTLKLVGFNNDNNFRDVTKLDASQLRITSFFKKDEFEHFFSLPESDILRLIDL